jgi:hypothetical protein
MAASLRAPATTSYRPVSWPSPSSTGRTWRFCKRPCAAMLAASSSSLLPAPVLRALAGEGVSFVSGMERIGVVHPWSLLGWAVAQPPGRAAALPVGKTGVGGGRRCRAPPARRSGREAAPYEEGRGLVGPFSGTLARVLVHACGAPVWVPADAPRRLAGSPVPPPELKQTIGPACRRAEQLLPGMTGHLLPARPRWTPWWRARLLPCWRF